MVMQASACVAGVQQDFRQGQGSGAVLCLQICLEGRKDPVYGRTAGTAFPSLVSDAYTCVASVMHHTHDIMYVFSRLRPKGNEHAILDAHACIASAMHHKPDIMCVFPRLRPESSKNVIVNAYACVARVIHHECEITCAEYAIFNT